MRRGGYSMERALGEEKLLLYYAIRESGLLAD
jgi:hypothetical protein